MRTLKSIIIYVFVFIIIFSSFKIPKIILQIENKNIEKAVYEKIQEKSTIDIEAEKIYLVKAIHNIDEYSAFAINQNITTGYILVRDIESINEPIYRELMKLKEINILKNINGEGNCKMSFIDKLYKSPDNEYTVKDVLLEVDGNTYELDVEEKTGKILSVFFKNENIDKEEVMRGYVQYLDLHIIDDWKFENDKLKSEKAELVINLSEYDGNYSLSIHSSNSIFLDIRDYGDAITVIDTN